MTFADYVGIPWEAGAQGPTAYDCMGFFREVQRAHFNVSVPMVIAPDYDNPSELNGLFVMHGERSNWRRVDIPQHGDAVIIHRPMHIGTWLDLDGGGILHCARRQGVIFTRHSSWHVSGFGRREYYRHSP